MAVRIKKSIFSEKGRDRVSACIRKQRELLKEWAACDQLECLSMSPRPVHLSRVVRRNIAAHFDNAQQTVLQQHCRKCQGTKCAHANVYLCERS